MTRETIYEFAGGETAFMALARAHHARCLADPELNHPFSHPGHPQHVERLGRYWAEVFGGPAWFTENAGGHPAMLAVHAGEEPPLEWGDRFVTCFVQAAQDADLPDDPQFRSVLRDYMEWAVRDAFRYPQGADRVPRDAPMPHWSWDGRQGEVSREDR